MRCIITKKDKIINRVMIPFYSGFQNASSGCLIKRLCSILA